MKHNTAWLTSALVSGLLAATGATAVAGNMGSSSQSSDTHITKEVKQALVKDKETKAKDIHVKTSDGVVSLSGTARSQAEKSKAEQDARAVQGVTDVHNDLTVRQAG
jgi:hyperosmotically inducible periplasmic protein